MTCPICVTADSMLYSKTTFGMPLCPQETLGAERHSYTVLGYIIYFRGFCGTLGISTQRARV